MVSSTTLRGLFASALLFSGASAACSKYIEAHRGDTCASLAQEAGITVGQFIQSNPGIPSCDSLVAGAFYCIEGKADTAPTPSTSAAPTQPTSGLKVSTDGNCGSGVTCQGSAFGNCCSAYGFCGSTSDHCLGNCQAAFGSCGQGAISSVTQSPPITTPPPAGSVTVTVTSTVGVTRTALITSTVTTTTASTVLTTSTVRVTATATATATATSTATVTNTILTTAVVTNTIPVTVTNTVPVTSTTVQTIRTIVTLTNTIIETSQATVTATSTVRTTQTVLSTSVVQVTRTTQVPVTVTSTDYDIVTLTTVLTSWETLTSFKTSTITTTSTRTIQTVIPVTETLTSRNYAIIREDDTCRSLAQRYNLTLLDFYALNPSVSKNNIIGGLLCTLDLLLSGLCQINCDALWEGWYVCVGK
ncbi:hypothetical protein QBC38DRAFT_511620 [Podospora fimiseda]|uniref:Carbohydrate-binding module family 18 protein n=1 Tax=Podospora fimiseda TaxID=252190 RepID=A0AAN7BJR7_9PEZI|nr:hypothetical protein QBC38DRAFT_511620 [Podospora fimiseda]